MNHAQLTQSSKPKLNSLDSLETNPLLIAITSQNKKHVTPHAGKCRKFWLYEIVQYSDDDTSQIVKSKTLHEFDKELCFKNSGQLPKELNGIHLFITAGIGSGFKGWLGKQFIACEVLKSDSLQFVDKALEEILNIKPNSV